MSIKKLLLIFYVAVGVCASHAKAGAASPMLSLDLQVSDGLIVARLRNVSSEPVSLIDGYQSINEEKMSGFFFDVTDSKGKRKKYCSMLDQGNPVKRVVAPGDSLYFKMDVWMLAGSHCLPPGRYSLKVVYLERESARSFLRVESAQVPLDVHSSRPDSHLTSMVCL